MKSNDGWAWGLAAFTGYLSFGFGIVEAAQTQNPDIGAGMIVTGAILIAASQVALGYQAIPDKTKSDPRQSPDDRRRVE